MRRKSRAFAPRPLYVEVPKDEKKSPTRVESDFQKEKLEGETKANADLEKLKATKLQAQELELEQFGTSTTTQEKKSVEYHDGDAEDDDDNDLPNINTKISSGYRRSNSFGKRVQISEPVKIEFKPKLRQDLIPIPPKKTPARDRYQPKPLFQTTTANYVRPRGNDGQNREKSSTLRRYYESDQLLKNRRNAPPPPPSETETESEFEFELNGAESQSSDECLKTIHRNFNRDGKTPLTAKEIRESPFYPKLVEDVKTVSLVRKLRRIVFDFRTAHEEHDAALLKIQERKKEKRAQVLQRMLSLDMVETRIFVMQSYDYEKYMSAATASQSTQASTQTNDDTEDQEAQTDPISDIRVRWTQMPPSWSDSNNALILEQPIRNRNFGVGEDTRFPNTVNTNSNDKIIDKRDLNEIDFVKEQEKFANFVRGASHLIMAILESKKQMLAKQEKKVLTLDRKLVVLRDLEIRTICCDQEYIACTNGHCDYEKYVGGKNVVTVWSLHEPSLPMFFLRVWGQVLVLEMSKMCSLVVTGNRDGSLNVWDMNESAQYHTRNREDQVIRTPSICTGGLLPEFQKHKTSIIGVQLLPESSRRCRIFSLDRNKILVFWSCCYEDSVEDKSEIGFVASQWAKLRIQIRQFIDLSEIFLPKNIDFKYLKMWDNVSFHFLIGTDYGFLGKGIVADTETKVVYEKIFADDMTNKVMLIYSVDLNSDRNLVVGACEDDNCRLFDLTLKKTISVHHCGGKPIKVRWSRRRRSVFYVLMENHVDIWDLLSSDLNPTKTMDFSKAKDFDLLSTRNNEFVVVVCGGGIKVETPSLEVNPLTTREESRFKMYLAIIQ